MSNVVSTPDGAMVRQRRTVAIMNPSEGDTKSTSVWDIVTDLSRPTEDAAFKRLGVFNYMIDFIRGGCQFGALEWSIIVMERQLMKTPFYHNAVVQIATRYKAPPAVIADMLSSISLKMTVRDLLGMEALPHAPMVVRKQLDNIHTYRDNRKAA